LSAADYGKVVGVSGLTIYSWEHGNRRPRKAQVAALVAARGISKREALAKLEVLKAKGQRGARRGRTSSFSAVCRTEARRCSKKTEHDERRHAGK